MHKLSQAKDAVLKGDLDAAEHLYRDVVAENPDSIAALSGLGAIGFERGDLENSLQWFEEAKTAGLKSHGGVMPSRLAWNDRNKPLLRALHGIALNLFRMRRTADAQAAFEELVRLNPDDNQGARLMLEDIKKGRYPWKDA